MKRILHFFKVRQRALRLRRFAERATSAVKTPIISRDIYADDGDLGYC